MNTCIDSYSKAGAETGSIEKMLHAAFPFKVINNENRNDVYNQGPGAGARSWSPELEHYRAVFFLELEPEPEL